MESYNKDICTLKKSDKATFNPMQKVMLSLWVISFLLMVSQLNAQTDQFKSYSVGFYNLENLFDTINNTQIKDEEFTPDGDRVWNSEKYFDKIANLASVISQMGLELCPDGLAILGVSEIENDTVLMDLIKHPLLTGRNLGIVHQNSIDERGIDVAMIYDKDVFEPKNVQLYRVPHPKGPEKRPTRDVMLVSGLLDGELIHLTVNHWPSRSGGEKRSSPFRNAAAQINRQIIDSLVRMNSSSKILVMGDLNDDPINESVTNYIRAKKKEKSVQSGDFFNPMYKYYKKGIGSNAYRDRWSLFDQILVSSGLLNKKDGVYFHKALIYNKKFLIQNFGKYKGYPFRTFDGAVYQGGYSDHLPVYVYLLKQV